MSIRRAFWPTRAGARKGWDLSLHTVYEWLVPNKFSLGNLASLPHLVPVALNIWQPAKSTSVVFFRKFLWDIDDRNAIGQYVQQSRKSLQLLEFSVEVFWKTRVVDVKSLDADGLKWPGDLLRQAVI